MSLYEGVAKQWIELLSIAEASLAFYATHSSQYSPLARHRDAAVANQSGGGGESDDIPITDRHTGRHVVHLGSRACHYLVLNDQAAVEGA